MKAKRSFFLDLFPPPAYLKMPAICLDVSDRSLKYLEFFKKGGRVAVRRFGLKPIPAGIIQKGEIKKEDEFVDFLKRIKQELKPNHIIASLPEEKVFLSRVKFPMMAKEKIKEALELQLEEYVPLAAKEAIFDFDVIRESEKENHIDMNIIAFPKEFVEGYRNAFRQSGFTPLAFEMEAHAFARAIVPETEQGNIMAVDFGRTRATFAIISRGKVQFATTVGVAGEEIEETIMANLKIAKEDVEKIKRESGFIRSKKNEQVFNSILPIVSVIKDEMARQIDYWVSHYDEHAAEGESGKGKAKISKIILCGGEATLAGLAEYLSYELKIKTELGNPWVNVCDFEDYIPEIEKGDSLAYATVIGLALRQWL